MSSFERRENTKNRYSLVLMNNITKEKIIIPTSEFSNNPAEMDKDKTLLSRIDVFTTKFKSTKEIIDYLLKKYVHNTILNFDNSDSLAYIDVDSYNLNNYSLYISYYQNKREKKLGIVDGRYTNIKYFAGIAQTYVDINNEYFKIFYNNFLSNIKDVLFFRHLKDKKYLNDYLLKDLGLEDFVYLDRLPSEVPLINGLSRYKVIRGILLGYNTFKNPERLIPLDFDGKNNKLDRVESKLELNTEDEYLNSAVDRDEIFGSLGYGLDELSRIDGVDGRIADGLYQEQDKVKEYYLK